MRPPLLGWAVLCGGWLLGILALGLVLGLCQRSAHREAQRIAAAATACYGPRVLPRDSIRAAR